MTEKLLTELVRDGAAFLVFLLLVIGPAMLVLRKLLGQQDVMIQGIMLRMDRLIEATTKGMRDTAEAVRVETEAHRDVDQQRHLDLLEAINNLKLHCARVQSGDARKD